MTDPEFTNFGALEIKDERDFIYADGEIGMAGEPFDWGKGFDIEQHLGIKLPIRHQQNTGSCGGFATSNFGIVMDFQIDGVLQIKSPKFVYAQTVVGNGGSDYRANYGIYINQGMGNEEDCPSYRPDGTTDEAFITNKADITQLARDNAKKDRAAVYAVVATDIDSTAQAIRDNGGVIIGIHGQNNGTWLSAFPKAPTTLQQSWSHWIYGGGAIAVTPTEYEGLKKGIITMADIKEKYGS